MPVPIILLQDVAGLLLLFVFVAGATGLLIYQHMNKPVFLADEDETVANEFKQWRESTGRNRQMLKAISSALWTLALIVYFLWSFSSRAWHITWLIFPIAGALSAILKAAMDLKQ